MTKQELQQKWKEIISAYRESGLSQSAFCRKQENISIRQLSYWLRKETLNFSPAKTSPTWISLKVSVPEESSLEKLLLVKVANATVEVTPGFDPQLLLDVVKTLSALC